MGGNVVEDVRGAKQAEPGAGGRHAETRQLLDELFEAQFDALYRFCLARTGEPSLADDATSEAFLAASRAFAEGKGADVDRPWLFVVARRRIVDQWRARERHRRRMERLTRSVRPELFDVVLEDDRGETAEQVLVALTSLPERQRLALTLRYLDDHSVAEVAEQLEVNYQTAESLLARGRRGFATAWEERS